VGITVSTILRAPVASTAPKSQCSGGTPMSSVRKPRGPRRTPCPQAAPNHVDAPPRRIYARSIAARRSEPHGPYWRALSFLGSRRCCREERPCPSERFSPSITRMPSGQPAKHSTPLKSPPILGTSIRCGSVACSWSGRPIACSPRCASTEGDRAPATIRPAIAPISGRAERGSRRERP